MGYCNQTMGLIYKSSIYFNMDENNEQEFSGAQGEGNSGGSSGGSSSGGGSSGGGSSGGGGSNGARGVDSSRYTPGEQRGARQIYEREYPDKYPERQYYREDYNGARRNQQRNYKNNEQGGQQPMVFVVPGSNEQNTNMEKCTYYPVPFGGAGFGYGAPVAPAVASGFDSGYYTHQAALMASENACKAAENTKDAAADVKDSIQILSNQMVTNQFSLLQKVCDAEKAAIENRGVLLAATLASQNVLQAQVADCCCEMKLMDERQNRLISEKFCDLNTNINEKFATLERRGLEDEIAELRQEKVDGVNNGVLSTLNAILTKIK